MGLINLGPSLQGLGYLHSMGKMHRDIKVSYSLSLFCHIFHSLKQFDCKVSRRSDSAFLPRALFLTSQMCAEVTIKA